MNLLVLTGLVTPPTREQLGVEGLAALVLAAERLLRTGFRPDAAFLAGCADYELDALAQAGDRVAAGTAALHGAAAQGLRQAATAALPVDGGAALESLVAAEELAANRAAADELVRGQLGESPVQGLRLVEARTSAEIATL